MAWTTKFGRLVGDDDVEPDLQPEYTASLRISSETLTFAELCERLGEPTDGYSRGDANIRRTTGRTYQPREVSLWRLASGVD